MPTYEYRCDACSHEFEEFQTITAPVKRKCPNCGKLKLQRLIGTGAGIIFKGGGFYETDYRSDSYKKAAEAEKKSSEPATSDTKSDAKKEVATASKSEAPAAAQSSDAPVKSKPAKSSAAQSKSKRRH